MTPGNPDFAGTIDPALAKRLVASQFPHWSDLPVLPVDPGGWDNRTFRLGNHMSVRLPSAAGYVAQVEKEHRWLPELATHLPLPIPVPLAMGSPNSDYPWPWSVYRWLEGMPAAPERIADLDDFAGSLAAFLRCLYRIDAADGPPAGAHNFHRGGNLAVYDAETRAAIAALGHRIDMRAAQDLWAMALESSWQRSPVWVHGDVAWDNLLVRDGRLAAVIDFGSSAVGDPACDLVIAWTLFSGQSRETFRAEIGLDDETWCRARGWALWKALITAAGHDANQREAEASWRIMEEVLNEYRQVAGNGPAVQLLHNR